jgi:hypothetical protein
MKIVNLTQAAAALGIGTTLASAIKRAAGIKSQKFELRVFVNYWRKHPDIKISDVYPLPEGEQRRDTRGWQRGRKRDQTMACAQAARSL